MKDNPLIARLTGQRTWFSLPVAFWLAFGLGLATLAISAWAFLHPIPSLLGYAIFGVVLLYILTPPVILVAAATATVRDVQGEPYQLLALTDISDAALVRGYVFAALYQWRALLWLLTFVGVWGLTLLAAALGAGLALWRRDNLTTTISAALAAVGVLMIELLLFVPLGLWYSSPSASAWSGAIFLMLAPYLLAFGLMRFSERRARTS